MSIRRQHASQGTCRFASAGALEPGFAAVLGPIGSYPLRVRSDLDRVRLIREMTPNIALASLFSRYAAGIIRPLHRTASEMAITLWSPG